ncbi:related to phosphoethanolamine N-methyltransferase [Ramularia collo-cygni]|uniref:Related to phosphoethanolamine N-methyltransferase n=1 Tax=Ramularia collo-cygni TaxID=112498 RepID=A0A2D3VD61_9PEZI|nr:related to phosphoethanolamine N-methyltransferase [Ramularia collo-cygni]CZT25010.1 related to phosphoethanolamine N-methyltransferase [Ramularia collo-cygni]
MASAVSNLHAGNSRFNAEAAAWDSRPFVLEASREASKAILAKLEDMPIASDGLQVLEIGCGTGILSFLLATDSRISRIVAVDAAEGMIDVLKEKLQKSGAPRNIVPLALLLEDPNDSALPAGPDGATQRFDLITSHLVLHHIPELRPVLRTMLGCLKPGGRVMLTDFEDLGAETKRFHPISKLDGVARHGINAVEMKRLMEDVGFAEVEVKSHWTMDKKVERFEGEFGENGNAKDGMGEMMKFPFVVCYGIKHGQA